MIIENQHIGKFCCLVYNMYKACLTRHGTPKEVSALKKIYDVFISYRREGGQDTARIIRDELRARGFRVFYDVETLRSGKFNEQLLSTIRECHNFILICSPGALDRCEKEDDWVRQELACALGHGKNVIPVLLHGFTFPSPETLPEDIREVCYCNGLAASHEHFDAFIRKLINFLKDPDWNVIFLRFLRSLPFNGRRAAAVIITVFALTGALVFGSYQMGRRHAAFPATAQEIGCVKRLVNCGVQNLSVYNNALHIYLDALDELIKYTDNSSNYQKQWPFDEYALDCRERILLVGEQLQQLDAMDAALVQDANAILGDRIDIADANAMPGALQTMIDQMTDSLSYFADLYCANGRNVNDPQLAAEVQRCRKIAELDRDSVFYAFNEMLLPVENQDILNTIKTEYLPMLTTFYVRQDWKTDKADIQSQMDSLYQTELSILQGMEEELSFDQQQVQQLEDAIQVYAEAVSGNELQREVPEKSRSVEETLLALDNYIAVLESRRTIESIWYNDKEGASTRYDETIRSLQASRDSLAEKYEKLQELQAKHQELQAELQDRREEAREKFKPLETDDPESLWGKGLHFITLKMPDMAAECFGMYEEKEGSAEAAVYVKNAQLFVQSMEETGVTGGCIVCIYEEGLPRQAFEIGDIFYAVDGQPVYTVEDYESMRNGRDAAVSVLRFQEDGSFVKMEIQYDSSRGRVGLLPLNETVS